MNDLKLKAIWDDKRRVYTLQYRGYEMYALFNTFVQRINAKLGDWN